MAFTIMRTAFRTRRSRYVSLLVLLALVAATVVLTTTRSAGSDIRSDIRAATATRVAGSVRSDPTAQLMGEARALVAQEQAPWIIAEWPIVTPLPTRSGTPGSVCMTVRSCTLDPSPMTIGSNSERSTQPYQTLAPASSTMLPTSVAFSATHAVG